MSKHIKTGKEISDELSDEMVSRFQKGSLDLTKLNSLEKEKWFPLSLFENQVRTCPSMTIEEFLSLLEGK